MRNTADRDSRHSRRRGALHRAAPTPSEREISQQLLAELVAVCLAAAPAYGVDAKRVLSALPATGNASLARKLFRNSYWLSELAVHWSEDSKYIDGSGRPSILPIRGRGATFERLVSKYFGKGRLPEILEFSLSTHVIQRSGRNRVLLCSPCVMLTGQPLLLLSRAVLCIRGLLASTESNALKSTERQFLSPDRMSCGVVDAQKYQQFADLMRPQLYNLADFGNRWLSQNAVRDRPTQRTDARGLMGVHAYVFRD